MIFNKKKMLIQNRHRFTTAYLESNYLQGNKKKSTSLKDNLSWKWKILRSLNSMEKHIYRKYYNNMIRRNVFDWGIFLHIFRYSFFLSFVCLFIQYTNVLYRVQRKLLAFLNYSPLILFPPIFLYSHSLLSCLSCLLFLFLLWLWKWKTPLCVNSFSSI